MICGICSGMKASDFPLASWAFILEYFEYFIKGIRNVDITKKAQ